MARRSKSRKVTNSGHYIPEQIIFNILSCTKVTSLLRFRSVCKSWRTLISNPLFLEAHHTNSDKIPSILIITSSVIDNKLSGTVLYSNSLEYSVSLNLMPPFNNMEYVSSCNGIILCVCKCSGNIIYLLNPLTMLFKKLPAFEIGTNLLIIDNYNRQQRQIFKVDVVFGYENVSRDFKVVRIKYGRDGDKELARVAEVQLYSSNSDSWKVVKVDVKLPCFVWFPASPVLRSGPVLDGVLYLESTNEIVTFDLRSEKFGVIPFPSSVQKRWMSNVFDYEGSIAMVVKSVGTEINLWTMETVGDEVFWNKNFTFDEGLEIDWVYLYLGAKQFFGKSKLGNPKSGHVLLDLEKKETKQIKLPDGSFLVRVFKHNESFLSLEGFGKVPEN